MEALRAVLNLCDSPKNTLRLWTGHHPVLLCNSCSASFDDETPPIAGRCGCIICGDCHNKHIIRGEYRKTEFVACPAASCPHRCSFERVQPNPLWQLSAVLKTQQESNAEVVKRLRKIYDEFVDIQANLMATETEYESLKSFKQASPDGQLRKVMVDKVAEMAAELGMGAVKDFPQMLEENKRLKREADGQNEKAYEKAYKQAKRDVRDQMQSILREQLECSQG